MRRILLLTTLAAMLAAAMALSGVAQAKPAGTQSGSNKCKQEAASLGLSLDGYNFISGTNKSENLSGGTDGKDVFCGFGGGDGIGTLQAGDIFIGGAGDERVDTNYGTYNGEAGNDAVYDNEAGGTFNGGADNDTVQTIQYGTFNGGAGDDTAQSNSFNFNGGDGNDQVLGVNSGYFYGEAGDDTVYENGNYFNGGDGNDSVTTLNAYGNSGVTDSVENLPGV